MTERVLGARIAGWVLLGCSLAVPGRAMAQKVTAVPKLDVNQYMGVWYEMARLPTRIEKNCVSDPTMLYALGTKARSLQIGIFCKTKDGSSDEWDAKGKMDKSGDGKLKFDHLWPFYKKFWVLATGPGYGWALVGSPNHKSLWILSRTRTMDPATLDSVKAIAAAQGFDTGKLISQPQNP